MKTAPRAGKSWKASQEPPHEREKLNQIHFTLMKKRRRKRGKDREKGTASEKSPPA